MVYRDPFSKERPQNVENLQIHFTRTADLQQNQ